MPVVERLLLDDGPHALHARALVLGRILLGDGRLLLVLDGDVLGRIGDGLLGGGRGRRGRGLGGEERARGGEEAELGVVEGEDGGTARKGIGADARSEARVHKGRQARRSRCERGGCPGRSAELHDGEGGPDERGGCRAETLECWSALWSGAGLAFRGARWSRSEEPGVVVVVVAHLRVLRHRRRGSRQLALPCSLAQPLDAAPTRAGTRARATTSCGLHVAPLSLLNLAFELRGSCLLARALPEAAPSSAPSYSAHGGAQSAALRS